MTDLSKADWRKSSYSSSNGGNCVEVAGSLPGVVAVRDSRDPAGGALTLTRNEWAAFLAGVGDGEFNLR
jgi:Domain of unknown function (DUF397)